MSELERSIRELISSYLSGDIDAVQLNDELPDAWDLDEADDPGATDLALSAIGYLAGFQAGDRDEDSLLVALSGLVAETLEVEYPAPELLTVLASRIAETIPVSVEGDSSLEEGFERAAAQNRQTRDQTTTVLLR